MKRTVIVIIILTTLFVACNGFKNEAKDKTGERIVCLSKQLTEIIFAVGGDTALVGVDLSSTYPEAAKKLTTVGYHRALTAEGIISINPTVIWHDGNIGPDNVVTQLEKVGIPLRLFKAGPSIDSTKELVMDLAKEFHNEKKGRELCEKLDNDMAKLDDERKKYSDKPRVLIVHFGQASNQYFVMNKNSNAQKMLEWAGAENATDTAQRWRSLSAEVMVAAQPDVILATDYGFDLQGSMEKFKQLPGIALTPAAKNNRIYRIEEHNLVYLGPRTGENVLNLMKLVHVPAGK
jgi:iron complex transport system substrate-binding protein